MDPLSRLLLRIAGGLSVLFVVLAGYALFVDDGENSLNPIAQAAERTRSFPGAKIDYSAVVSLGSRSFSMQGRGAFNGRTGRSRIVMRMQAPPPVGEIRMEVVGDERGNNRSVYMRSPLIAKTLPPGDEWLGIDAFLAQGSEATVGGSGDPRQILDQLRAAGEVEELGSEEVRGVETTRFSAMIDEGRFASLLREEAGEEAARVYEKATEMVSFPSIEVWIDGNDLVRRMRMVMEMQAGEGQPAPATVTMQVDYHDFGVRPRISLPSPDRVFDATSLARAELDLPSAGTARLPKPQTSAPALSAAAFHRRGTKICRGMERRVRALQRRTAARVNELEELREQGVGQTDPEEYRKMYGEAADIYYEPVLRIADRALVQLSHLRPPRDRAADFRRFLRVTKAGIESTLASSQALKVWQLKTAAKLDRKGKRFFRRSDEAAKRAGLDACVGPAD